jgi:hypothetical protein
MGALWKNHSYTRAMVVRRPRKWDLQNGVGMEVRWDRCVRKQLPTLKILCELDLPQIQIKNPSILFVGGNPNFLTYTPWLE